MSIIRQDMSRSTGVTARPPRVLIADGQTLFEPAVVVYRLETGDHQQTGVVVEASLDDYRSGRIRRHEQTQPARVRQLDEQTESCRMEQMPVMLVHKGQLSGLAEITGDAPDVRLTIGGVTHSVWVCRDSDRAHTLCTEIARLGTLYIADGHHRMCAAVNYADRHGHFGADHPASYTLAALFPSEQMRILTYHRCYALRPRVSAGDLLKRLADNPVTARIEETPLAEPEPGAIAVGFGDRWYRLRLHSTRDIDAFVLEQDLLPKLRDLIDEQSPNTEHRLEHCRCNDGSALRLVAHPPSIEQVLAISDEGRTMPPKSTWFDPKPTTELFRRPLT